MKLLKIISLPVLLSLSFNLGAAEFYVGGSISDADLEDETDHLKYSAASFALHAGFDFWGWFGTEARIGSTTRGKKADDTHMRAVHYESLLIRMAIPLGRDSMSRIYGLGGFTVGRFKADVPSNAEIDTYGVGPSYGLGFDVNMGDDYRFAVEYLQMVNDSEKGVDYNFDQIGVSLVRRF